MGPEGPGRMRIDRRQLELTRLAGLATPDLGPGQEERRRAAFRASRTDIPAVTHTFTRPLMHNFEDADSGVRRRGVLLISGTELDVMKPTLETCVTSLSKVAGVIDLGLDRDASVPQLQI